MNADLKERAREWYLSVLRFGETEDQYVDSLASLLAEVRAETEARVVEAAAQVCEDIALDPRDSRPNSMALECRDHIRALAPADYVAVRRDDFEAIADAAEELEARIRMERAGYESSRADEIRAALSRARKGE